jgi:hypothetical protein
MVVAMTPSITVTIRKRSSGYKIVAFACDSHEHAYAIACILARSAEYQRCFLVGTAMGDEVFVVGAPSAMMAQSPPACAPPGPALPPYAPPQYGYMPQHPYPATRYAPEYHPALPAPAVEVEGQLVEDEWGPPPGFPPSWQRR